MNTRQMIQAALAEVYSGAGQLEAGALIDHLTDRGLVVVRADDLVDLRPWLDDDTDEAD